MGSAQVVKLCSKIGLLVQHNHFCCFSELALALLKVQSPQVVTMAMNMEHKIYVTYGTWLSAM